VVLTGISCYTFSTQTQHKTDFTNLKGGVPETPQQTILNYETYEMSAIADSQRLTPWHVGARIVSQIMHGTQRVVTPDNPQARD